MRLSLVSAAFLLAACSSVNPAMKARTDELLSKVGTHQEAAPPSYAPRPWKAGSWVAHKMVSDGNSQYQKTSILSEGPEGVWVEHETWSYQSHDITKVLYSKMPATAEEATELMARMVSKHNDGAVTDMDFAANPMAKAMMRGMGGAFIQAPRDLSSAPKEDVTIPAGTFKGTARYDGSWSFGPISQQVTAWWHPNVPIDGTVKAQSPDGKFTSELVDYGWTGAASAL